MSKSKKRVAASSEPVSLTRPEAEASTAEPRSRTKRGSAMEARLQTAVSSAEVYSTISYGFFFSFLFFFDVFFRKKKSGKKRGKKEKKGEEEKPNEPKNSQISPSSPSQLTVHRLEHLIVPRFCWLLLALQASL